MSPTEMTSILSILGEWTGKVRSTPTPKECFLTVIVSRAPLPWRLIQIPWKIWTLSRLPSVTRKCTFKVSPALKATTSSFNILASSDSMTDISQSFVRLHIGGAAYSSVIPLKALRRTMKIMHHSPDYNLPGPPSCHLEGLADCRLHSKISAWLPLNSTSGTRTPPSSKGRPPGDMTKTSLSSRTLSGATANTPSSAAATTSTRITIPGPPPYGESSTCLWLRGVNSRISCTAKSMTPFSTASEIGCCSLNHEKASGTRVNTSHRISANYPSRPPPESWPGTLPSPQYSHQEHQPPAPRFQ